jgi:hypothetical protein
MRSVCPVETETASAPPSDRSDHQVGAKLTMGDGAPTAPRGPIGTATNVMSPETIARATTSVAPLGRHPLASGVKTWATSMIRGGGTLCVGEGVGAEGAALVAAVVAVAVGDDAADVAAGGPDCEHAAISAARTNRVAFLTRGA